MNSIIREIVNDDEIGSSVGVIREAFRTVASEFNLTAENCPTHPSFVTFERLKELQARGQMFFGLFTAGTQVGFVAMENSGDSECTMEKLAVLPQARHNEYGSKLVRSVLDHASRQGARKSR